MAYIYFTKKPGLHKKRNLMTFKMWRILFIMSLMVNIILSVLVYKK